MVMFNSYVCLSEGSCHQVVLCLSSGWCPEGELSLVPVQKSGISQNLRRISMEMSMESHLCILIIWLHVCIVVYIYIHVYVFIDSVCILWDVIQWLDCRGNIFVAEKFHGLAWRCAEVVRNWDGQRWRLQKWLELRCFKLRSGQNVDLVSAK